MKKIAAAIVLSLLLITTASAQQEGGQKIKFTWQQAAADLPSLQKWTLYSAEADAGPWRKVIDVPYLGGQQTDYTSETPFEVLGNPGAKVVRFFRMTATSRSSQESLPSNVASCEFLVPYVPVGAPVRFTVEILLQ